MKKTILIITALISSVVCFGQKDTAKLTDTTKFLSIADINKYATKYQDIATYKEYQSFISIMNAILKEAIADYNEKQKKK